MVHRLLVVGALAIGALMLGACADDGARRATTPETRPPASTGTDIAVTGRDSLRFQPDTLMVPADEEVTLTFSAESGVEHDFVIEDAAAVGVAGAQDVGHRRPEDDGQGHNDDIHVAHADPGQITTATFKINDPGTYTVYCSVPGHRQGGMLATLRVTEGS